MQRNWFSEDRSSLKGEKASIAEVGEQNGCFLAAWIHSDDAKIVWSGRGQS